MLPGNAKDFKDNIDKKTAVVLIVGILIGVAYVDGIPLSYSKVQFTENSHSYFELTKTKVPLLKTSITIKYMYTEGNNYKDDYAQECRSAGSFTYFISNLIFMDSNDEIIWADGSFHYSATQDDEYRTGDPNNEMEKGTSNDDSSCNQSDSIWYVKIKMNGNPVKVQNSATVRTF